MPFICPREAGSLYRQNIRAHAGEGQIGFTRIADAAHYQGACDLIEPAILPPGLSIGGPRPGKSEEEFHLVLGSSEVNRPGDDAFRLPKVGLVRDLSGGEPGNPSEVREGRHLDLATELPVDQ